MALSGRDPADAGCMHYNPAEQNGRIVFVRKCGWSSGVGS